MKKRLSVLIAITTIATMMLGTNVQAVQIPDEPTLQYMQQPSISKEVTADMINNNSPQDNKVMYSRAGAAGMNDGKYYHSIMMLFSNTIKCDLYFKPTDIFLGSTLKDYQNEKVQTGTQEDVAYGNSVLEYNGQYQSHSRAVYAEEETDSSKFLDFHVTVDATPDTTNDYTSQYNVAMSTAIQATGEQMDPNGYGSIIPSLIPMDGNTYTNGVGEFIKLVSIKPSQYPNVMLYHYIETSYEQKPYDGSPTRPYMFYGTFEADDYVYVEPKTNPNTPTTPMQGKSYTGKRLSGQDRFQTSLAIANEYNSGTVNNVILATAYNFPDALSGSVLAQKLNAPILLVGNSLTETTGTINYIKAHLANSGTIYLLGGNGVIPDSYISYFNSLGYSNIVRLAGSDREGTAKAISDKEQVAKGTPVVIATEDGFADALSISTVAASMGYPILLTTQNNLPQSVKDELSSIQPSKVFIVGGTGVISDNVRNDIKSSVSGITDANIIRLSGSDRFATSLAIASYFNLNTTYGMVATGYDFPDALAGSVLGAKLNAPMLLVDSANVQAQKTLLDKTGITNLYILGGTGVVSDNALSNLTK